MKKYLAILLCITGALFFAASALADDDFNRADGKLAVRMANNNYGPWVPINASNTSIYQNRAIADNSGFDPYGNQKFTGAIWQDQYQPGTPTGNQEWYFTLRKSGTPTGYHWTLLARAATGNAYTGQSHYYGYGVRIFNSGAFQLFRQDNNVTVWHDDTTVPAPVDGDVIGVKAYGSTIQAWYLHGSTWTIELQHDDTTYATGFGGFMVSQTGGARGNVALDDFTSTQPTATNPTVCNTCPAYFEYTGTSYEFSKIQHAMINKFGRKLSSSKRAMVGNYLDYGDVFKLNASKTGYDYQDANALDAAPGWCGAYDGYWCGVLGSQFVPLQIITYRRLQLQPRPSCNPQFGDITPDPNFIIFYRSSVKCTTPVHEIRGTLKLYRLTIFKHSAQNVDFNTDLLPIVGEWHCTVMNSSGTFEWTLGLAWSVIDSSGRAYIYPETGSGDIPITATPTNPVCVT